VQREAVGGAVESVDDEAGWGPVGVMVSAAAAFAGVAGSLITLVVLQRGQYFCETVVGGSWGPARQVAADPGPPVTVVCPDGIGYLLPSLTGGAVMASVAGLLATVALARRGVSRQALARGVVQALAVYGVAAAVLTLPAILIGLPVITLLLCGWPWLLQTRGGSPRPPLLLLAGVTVSGLALGSRAALLLPFLIVPAVAAVTALVLLHGRSPVKTHGKDGAPSASP
jgi:hypothetical protein